VYQGQCHCGTVRFTTTEKPQKLVDCNCSICRRVAALWAHVTIDSVTIDAPSGACIPYVQGDKTLAVNSCRQCGCTTHWENLRKDGEVMAVNFRMCEPETIAEFQIRKFDGADTWKFLD